MRAGSAGRIRIGIDTGGTFTDIVAVDGATGGVAVTKVPSTPANPAIGLVQGVRQILTQTGRTVDDLAGLAHGTTVATNALLQGEIESLGLIVTAGFRHLLEIARQSSVMNGQIECRLLEYDVRTAEDAESGLEIAHDFEPHLILSDIGLPGMDGYALAPELRKAAGARKLVLAAATSYGLASDKRRARDAGFDYHLVKPVDADLLISFVARQQNEF